MGKYLKLAGFEGAKLEAPTDKIDKTPTGDPSSVSFVGDSPGGVRTSFSPERIIEATFRAASRVGVPVVPVEYAEPQAVTPVSPEFPPCPKCGAIRYWITRGRVLCGSRTCYSAVRFILTKIEYHQVH